MMPSFSGGLPDEFVESLGTRFGLKRTDIGDHILNLVVFESRVAAFGGHVEFQNAGGIGRDATCLDESLQCFVAAGRNEFAVKQIRAEIFQTSAILAVTRDAVHVNAFAA